MKVIELIRNTPLNSVISDKRILYFFKRKGFIWDYSEWGYLEDLRIYTSDKIDFTLEISQGNCKKGEILEGALFEKTRQTTARTSKTFGELVDFFECYSNSSLFTCEGMEFRTKYISGCFNPFLIRTK